MAKWTNKSINSFSFFAGILGIIVGIIMLIKTLFSGGDSEAIASSLFIIGFGIIFILWNLFAKSIKPYIIETGCLLSGICLRTWLKLSMNLLNNSRPMPHLGMNGCFVFQ
ncbi:MAG: hypothetical protein LBG57_08200 [Treponema sp.]|jgi:hypothetical protein|nr:hypothetical protein [Treponema sp.]